MPAVESGESFNVATNYSIVADRYEPRTPTTFTTSGTAGTARRIIAGKSMRDEFVHIVGGVYSVYTNQHHVLDITTGAYSAKSNIPSSRAYYADTAAIHDDELKYFVFGGYAGAGGSPESSSLKTAYRYNPSANTWTQIATMPTTGSQRVVRCAWDGDDYIYIHRATSFLRYSISGNSYTSMANSTHGNAYAYMAYSSVNNAIYALLGSSGATCRKYDITGNSWSSLSDAPGAANYGAVHFQYNGKLWIYGGVDGGVGERNKVWAFNVDTEEWESRPSLSEDTFFGAGGYYDGAFYHSHGTRGATTNTNDCVRII